MVKSKLALAALLVSAALSGVRADDGSRDRDARAALALSGCGKNTPCPHDRAARAALALSEAAPAGHAGAVAPAPKAKDRPAAKSCICGDNCKCAAGKCPACPTSDLALVRDSLVRVKTPGGQGSGTVVYSKKEKSVVLTAAHVVATGSAYEVRSQGKWHKAELIAADPAADLAALLVGAELPAAAVGAKDPADGAEVLMLGVTSLWSKGTVANRYRLGQAEVFELRYDSDSGDSGGGVFAGGSLVGVHCGKVNGNPYCASGKAVRAFLESCLSAEGPKVPAPRASAPVRPALCGPGGCAPSR
jgi:S1-C subfamily serine protease